MHFRQSIWLFDARYDIDSELEPADLRNVARLQSIEAAKKRTPPIPVSDLKRIGRLLEFAPDVRTVTAAEFARYLGEILSHGAGIKTAVCMLAVISGGKYPPMDEKVARGLYSLGLINKHDVTRLNGTSLKRFSLVYIEKVLVEWRARLAEGIDPKALDAEWAGFGKDTRL